MIGIFDSGFGGLTILKEIYKTLPQYDYLYLGDSARNPYGNRSQELIYEFSHQCIEYLFASGCELIIIACGTASSESLKKLQQEYLPKKYPEKRILGIIRPLVEKALRVSRHGRIGIVGTKGTVQSKAFPKEIEKESKISGRFMDKRLEIYQESCPLIVPLVEEGWTKKAETKMILKRYLRPLKAKKIDTLILGCTHYPILYKDFQKIMGENCHVLNTGKVVAESLKNYLERHPEIESKLTRKGRLEFLSTDNTDTFDKFGGEYFGKKIKTRKVELKY